MQVIVKKETPKDAMDTNEVINLFNKAQTLEEVKSVVERAKDRLYASFATVDVRDKDGQKIGLDDFQKYGASYMERGGPIMDNHSNHQVGRCLAWKIMDSPTGKPGVLQLNKIYNHYPLDDKVWKEIQTGERSGSSVGGLTMMDSNYVFDEGLITEKLEDFNWFETSSVDTPANQLALNQAVSAVAKSDKNSPQLFVKLGGTVYKMLAVNKPCPSKKPKKEEGEKYINQKEHSEVQDKSTTGDNMGETQETSKADIKDVAMQKIAAGEQLTKEEHEAITFAAKALAPKKQEEEEDREEDEKKPDEGKDKAVDVAPKDGQPKDERPEEENQIDALKGEMGELKKSISELTKNTTEGLKAVTKTISTSRPGGQGESMSEVKKFNDLASQIIKNDLKGTLNERWAEVNKAHRQAVDQVYGA